MKLSEVIVPVSEAKARTAKMIEDVVRNRRPAVITQNGRAKVIVEDLRTYEETHESLAMLKIVAQGRANVRAGKTKPLKRACADVRRRAQERRST